MFLSNGYRKTYIYIYRSNLLEGHGKFQHCHLGLYSNEKFDIHSAKWSVHMRWWQHWTKIRSAIREPAWLRKLKANCQLDDFSSDLAMAERLGVWEELICSRTPSVWQEWRRAHEPLGLLDGCGWCNWPTSCNPVLYLLHPSKQSR